MLRWAREHDCPWVELTCAGLLEERAPAGVGLGGGARQLGEHSEMCTFRNSVWVREGGAVAEREAAAAIAARSPSLERTHTRTGSLADSMKYPTPPVRQKRADKPRSTCSALSSTS